MFVYVTGISGSGKSTVRKELTVLGYDAYDVDEDSFKSWYNKAKDTLANDQKAWEDTSVEWRNRYWLKIERAKVEMLANEAKKNNSPTFLCGTTPNDKDIWDLFDKVLFLKVSNNILAKRLAERTDNDYGKHPDDLKNILEWNETAAERNQSYGAKLIDAEQPIKEVVKAIIKQSS